VFTDTHDDGGFRQVLTEVERGDARTTVFAVPRGKTCPLGIYELALLSSGHLRRREATDAELLIVTPESRPLEVFGPRASSAVGELLIGAGIELRVGSEPIESTMASSQFATERRFLAITWSRYRSPR